MVRNIIGIDEAGRGPLAGPVAVGSVLVHNAFDWEILSEVDDSKKLTPETREHIFNTAKKMKKEGLLDFQVALISASVIDRIGIVPAIRKGIARTLHTLSVRKKIIPADVHIKLDGSLKAPDSFLYQETIVRGDSLLKIIGLASILAKVTRDRHMCMMGKRYPDYGFELHKGYGTAKHRKIIMLQGLTGIHRQTFCTRLRD
ncbi:MAG: ribonuclease HII [Candidatus Paceibacterota bacterium]